MGAGMGEQKASIIAIVDDLESIRLALRSLLRSVGFTAEAFPSAEDFLHSDHLGHTACLILDLQIPGMSGLELQQHLAAARCRIPIIFITADCDETAEARALEAGAIDFLQKPFREDALLHAVRVALQELPWRVRQRSSRSDHSLSRR